MPDELVSFERLLLLPKAEWEETAKKSKLPKPKIDKDVLDAAINVLESRLKEYPTTLEVRHPLPPRHLALTANRLIGG